jgi:hypothetical protein
VEIEDSRASAVGGPEPVLHSDRRGEELARPCHDRLVLAHELHGSVEDEERIDVVVVPVRRDLERRLELDLDEGQLREGEADGDNAVLALEPLAAARARDNGVATRRVVRRILVVFERIGLLACVGAPQVLGESARRRMDVEEPHRPRRQVVEAVDDAGRHRDGVPGLERQRLGRRQDLDLALEHDERVDVLGVEVPAGARRPAGPPERERDDRVEVRQHLCPRPRPLHHLHDTIL